MDSATPSFSNYYWLCPLYSFDCDCESIDLTEGIQVTRIAQEFEVYLQGRWSDWMLYRHSDTRYMIQFPYRNVIKDKSKSIWGNRHVSDLLVVLVTSLRLQHAGMVTPGQLVLAKLHNNKFSIFSLDNIRDFDDIGPGMSVGPIITAVSKEGVEPLTGPIYRFYQSEVDQVYELVKHLVKLLEKKEPDNLSIALRRFNSAYHGELEDRLIDQMIAFESLYLGRDAELRYRLALRLAFLLGNDDGERENIFRDMKEAYDTRSDIVHGNKKVDRAKLEETVPKTEEYLRQSIRRFILLLSQGNSLKDIREKLLDENILKNGRILFP